VDELGLDFSKTDAKELIGRAALMQLLASVNSEIAIHASAWAARDMELDSVRGIAYSPVHLEEIATEHMYLGHIPTLIDAPVEMYPNFSVLAYRVSEVENGGWDQKGHLHRVELAVEVMVKSLESEEVVNKRIQRTSDCVNQVILNDPTLRGLVSSTEFVSVDVSDVFIRREEKSRGPRWFWQGARLEYTIDKPAAYA